MFKRIIISLIFFLLISKSAFAYTSVQNVDTSISSTSRNAFLQAIGQGDNTSLTSVTIAVKNTSGSNVAVNASAFKIFNYASSSYTGSYPTPYDQPTSITCNPTSRCTGTPVNAITSGTEVVYVTGHFTSVSLLSTKWYLIGYVATNLGNKLLSVGSSSDQVSGSCYYEETGISGMYTYGNHNYYYINKCSGVEDMYFSINGALGNPTGAIDTEVADPIARTLTVSGHYQFNYTGSGYRTMAAIYQQCVATDGSTYIPTTPVATIKWWASDSVTSTQSLGSNLYTGHGYTSTDSMGYFESVVLPYTEGQACTFPSILYVWDSSGDIVWSTPEQGNGIPVELIPSGSTSLISSPSVPTEQQGIFGGIITWVRDFATSLFSFTPVVSTFQDNLQLLDNYIRTKAPFGYVLTAFSLDTVQPVDQDVVPDFTYNLSAGGYGNQDVSIDFPPAFDSIFGTLKLFISICMWLIFFGYVVVVGRRLQR